MTEIHADRPAQAPADAAAWLLWIAPSVAAAALLFSMAAYAPVEVKKIGLYGLALGALAGFGLGRWALYRQIRRPTLVCATAFLLVALGQILSAVQACELRNRALRDHINPQALAPNPIDDAVRQLIENPPEEPQSPEEAREREVLKADYLRGLERKERYKPTFMGYLTNRIPPVWGTWTAPWPAIFWVAEVLLATTCGAWVARVVVLRVDEPHETAPPDSTRLEPAPTLR
jgi:hypothetical protein